jgi:hypothetical protein
MVTLPYLVSQKQIAGMEAKQQLCVFGFPGIMPVAPLCVIPIPAMPNIDIGSSI